MSGYIIYHYRIIDRERINEIGPLSLPILEKYGGKVVVGSFVTRLEGEPHTHMVVYKFENKEKALAFYHSEESRELSKLRAKITEGFAVFVPEYSFI